MTDMRATGFDHAAEFASEIPSEMEAAALVENAREPIGMVLEIGGAGSEIALDLQRLTDCANDSDPSVALA